MSPGYTLDHIRVLKLLENNSSFKKEDLRKNTGLQPVRLYRVITRLLIDGLIEKENKDGAEYYKITEKGREYLRQLREVLA